MGPRGAFLGVGQQQYQPAPNAALLIDFDNVTMAIRSDLGKELKSLLKSDVIRGKVAVQRAYADWRRYPQYIVPLTESSVDLIFAPAYGSAKKNATDLRMAIDAIELVFTRPEIGTFILMTGDSDFSSCVLKLKEYGKYVIGVGMRESSSDLLIQNCDEYYSYHSISGLTRAGEVEESKEDPWVLVRRAVQRMVKDGDVMRTDRLKQVMLDLDPGFDEKKVGYSKFSRFVSEAATKGIIQLRKAENGQYEITAEGVEPESREKVVERIVAEAEAGGNGRRRRGRGRDDRSRDARPRPETRPAVLEAEAQPEIGSLDEAEPVLEALAEAAAEPAAAAPESPVVAAAGPEEFESPATEASIDGRPGLNEAYALLQEAVRRLTSRDSKAVRDGDVKRKMLELSKSFDENQLGFAKFTRFLRQAHDAEVIDLNRAGAGNYEVSLPAGGKKLRPPRFEEPARVVGSVAEPETTPARSPTMAPQAAAVTEPEAPPASAAPTAAPAPGVGALRGRRGGRGAAAGPPPILPGQGVVPPGRAAAAGTGAVTPGVVEPEPPVVVEAASVEEAPATPADEAKGRGRGRRGRRGRGGRDATVEGVEGLEAGQTTEVPGETPVVVETVEAPPAAEAVEPSPVAAPSEAAAPAASRRRRGRRGAGKLGDEAPPILEGQAVKPPTAAATATVVEPAPVVESTPPAPAPEKPKRARAPRGRKPAAAVVAPPPEKPAFSAAALGLPESLPDITAYLATRYKGVGKKTAETLVERFGSGAFEALQERPEEVTAALDERRASTLLKAWADDYAKRITTLPAAVTQSPEVTSPAAPAKAKAAGAKRGGRARPRSRKDSES